MDSNVSNIYLLVLRFRFVNRNFRREGWWRVTTVHIAQAQRLRHFNVSQVKNEENHLNPDGVNNNRNADICVVMCFDRSR